MHFISTLLTNLNTHSFDLLEFYSTSTFVGYLMPNPLYTCILDIYTWLGWVYGISTLVGYLMPNPLYIYIYIYIYIIIIIIIIYIFNSWNTDCDPGFHVVFCKTTIIRLLRKWNESKIEKIQAKKKRWEFGWKLTCSCVWVYVGVCLCVYVL